MIRPKIGIDVSGGDSSDVTREAVLMAAARHAGIEVVAYGRRAELERTVAVKDTTFGLSFGLSMLTIVECAVHIKEMRRIVEDLSAGRLDAWVTLTKSELVWGALNKGHLVEPGLISPALMAPLPTLNTAGRGGLGFLMDVGLTRDIWNPEIYVQWGRLGSRFITEQYGIAEPRIGLYWIAEEVKRAPKWLKQIHEQLQKAAPGYLGLAEPKLVRRGMIDLWLAMGMIGNGVIKVLGTWLEPDQKSDPVFLNAPVIGLLEGKVVCRIHGASTAEQIAGGIVSVQRYLRDKPV